MAGISMASISMQDDLSNYSDDRSEKSFDSDTQVTKVVKRKTATKGFQ